MRDRVHYCRCNSKKCIFSRMKVLMCLVSEIALYQFVINSFVMSRIFLVISYPRKDIYKLGMNNTREIRLRFLYYMMWMFSNVNMKSFTFSFGFFSVLFAIGVNIDNTSFKCLNKPKTFLAASKIYFYSVQFLSQKNISM